MSSGDHKVSPLHCVLHMFNLQMLKFKHKKYKLCARSSCRCSAVYKFINFIPGKLHISTDRDHTDARQKLEESQDIMHCCDVKEASLLTVG